MKKLYILFLSATLCSCANDGTLSPGGQKAVTTGLGIAQIALNTYLGYSAATAGGAKVSPAQTAALAQNSLNGVATLLQAYQGQSLATPTVAANVASGAGNPVVGSAVVAALPQGVISQAVVNAVFSAATQVPKAAVPTAMRGRHLPLYASSGEAITPLDIAQVSAILGAH